MSGLAGRYAAALFELADEGKALDAVAGDLKSLRTMIEESEDLRRLLRSPLFGREQQMRAIGAIMDKAALSDLTKRFVLVVARNRRLFSLPGMIEGYLAELARRRGEVTARVASARPLSDAQRDKLAEILKTAVGAKVTMDLKVDESLLGGLVVQVGSRMVDGSLKTKLAKLQNAMKGA